MEQPGLAPQRSSSLGLCASFSVPLLFLAPWISMTGDVLEEGGYML